MKMENRDAESETDNTPAYNLTASIYALADTITSIITVMLTSLLQKSRNNKLIHFLRTHSVLFAKYSAMLSLHRMATDKSLIFYTMGAVGATEISKLLAPQLEDYAIYDTQWLDKDNLDLDRKFNVFFHRKNKKAGINTELLPSHLVHGYYLRKRLRRLQQQDNPVKIVTLTRDPVERNVLSFFTNLRTYYRYDISARLAEVDLDTVVKELSALFVYRFLDKNGISFFDSNPLTWFDEELKRQIGIDVYDKAFSNQEGFSIYKKNQVELLLLRYEDLEQCFEKASDQFLGQKIEFFQQPDLNNEKSDESVYEKFIQEVKIPDYYLDDIYHSRYASHFYTEEEISSFKKRWINKRTDLQPMKAEIS